MCPVLFSVLPSTVSVKFKDVVPKINAAFVAPTASIIGKVTIGHNSLVWYNTVLRGDDNTITVGDNVSIGDRVMINCSGAGNTQGDGRDAPTVIGNGSVIQAGAILHGIHVLTSMAACLLLPHDFQVAH
jgi:carbonic anhydrase/acetyltransferase-like protein (isoleucine patch superfamily)